MSVTLLDELLKRGSRTVLTEAGFLGRGKTLRRPGPEGSVGIVEFLVDPGTISKSVSAFSVVCGVYVAKPRPWLSAGLQADLASVKRGAVDGQVRAFLLPSASSRWSRIVGGNDIDTWGLIDTEPMEAMADELVAGLRDVVVPFVERLLAARGGLVSPDSADSRLWVSWIQPPFEEPAKLPLGEALYQWPEPNPSTK